MNAKLKQSRNIVIIGAAFLTMATGFIAYELFGPRDLNITKADTEFFRKNNVVLAQKIGSSAQLTVEEKKHCIDWLCDIFSKKGFPYAAKYMYVYIHPENLKTRTMNSWDQRVPGTFHVYDITSDWNKAGFNALAMSKILTQARLSAKNRKDILRILNSGGEALLLSDGLRFSPLEIHAMENFSFYVQKGGAGKIIIRVKDIYDFRSKSLFFKLNDADAKKIMQAAIDDGKLHQYFFGVYRLDDSFWIKYGTPFILMGEWVIDEQTFYSYFGN